MNKQTNKLRFTLLSNIGRAGITRALTDCQTTSAGPVKPDNPDNQVRQPDIV